MPEATSERKPSSGVILRTRSKARLCNSSSSLREIMEPLIGRVSGFLFSSAIRRKEYGLKPLFSQRLEQKRGQRPVTCVHDRPANSCQHFPRPRARQPRSLFLRGAYSQRASGPLGVPPAVREGLRGSGQTSEVRRSEVGRQASFRGNWNLIVSDRTRALASRQSARRASGGGGFPYAHPSGTEKLVGWPARRQIGRYDEAD
jgi:hypothetical protein